MHDLFVLLMRKGNRFLNFNYFYYYFIIIYYYLICHHIFQEKIITAKNHVFCFYILLQRKRNKDSEKKLHKFDFTNV